MNIVQIGTCQANDDLTDIIGESQPEKLILVEPIMMHNTKILECYSSIKNLYLENLAIVPQKPESGHITFYYHINDGPRYEVASTTKEHILKHGNHVGDPAGIRSIEVPAWTINELFSYHNLTTIDILFLDAEGLDDAIIKSINFDKYDIKIIFFENLHLKQPDIYSFLEGLGYSIEKSVLSNGWCSMAAR